MNRLIARLIQKYQPFYTRNKMSIHYLFFGGVTTAVDFIVYYCCKAVFLFLGMPEGWITETATTVAWVAAVLVAFVTNKLFVFESHDRRFATVMREFVPFVVARLLSYAMTLLFMSVGVDTLGIHDFIVKTVTTVFVLVFNYVASKWFIFKNTAK